MSESLFLSLFVLHIGGFMLVLLLMTPVLSSVNRRYGESIPLSYAHAPQLKDADRTFTTSLLAVSLPLIALATYLASVNETTGLVLLGVLPFVQLGAGAWAITRARRVVRELKTSENWYSGIETGRTFDIQAQRAQPLTLPRGWFLASALIVLLWAVVLAIKYPALPDPYPVHFNAVGEADGWGEKSVGAVFMPWLVGLGTLVLMWGCAVFMSKQLTASNGGGTALASVSKKLPLDSEVFTSALGISAADYLKMRNTVVAQKSLHLLCIFTLLMTALLAFMDLGSLIALPGWLRASQLWIFMAVILSFCLLMTLSAARAGKSLDAAVLQIAQAGAVDPAELELPDESNHIKFGIFYYNPDNPNMMVPKHIGVGVSPNWAHPGSWVFGGVVGLSVLAAIVLPLVAS